MGLYMARLQGRATRSASWRPRRPRRWSQTSRPRVSRCAQTSRRWPEGIRSRPSPSRPGAAVFKRPFIENHVVTRAGLLHRSVFYTSTLPFLDPLHLSPVTENIPRLTCSKRSISERSGLQPGSPNGSEPQRCCSPTLERDERPSHTDHVTLADVQLHTFPKVIHVHFVLVCVQSQC